MRGVTLAVVTLTGTAISSICLVGAVPLVVLRGEHFLVQLNPAAAFTPVFVEYDGSIILDGTQCGSCQGTVLRALGEEWLGSCHGGEVVESVTLWVDGAARDILSGMVYEGHSFTVEKVSSLGSVATLNSMLSCSPRAIIEQVSLTTVRAGLVLGVTYPFLSTHQNRFTEVIGVRWPDRAIVTGSTALDGGSEFSLGSSQFVGQYDPRAQEGVVTMFTEAMAQGGTAFIWDRVCDNKLYFGFRGFANPVPQGTRWSFRTVRFPFRTAEVGWHSAARVVPGDFDYDGDCDLSDFSRLQNLMGLEASLTDFDLVADYDGDGIVNRIDVRTFIHMLLGPDSN